MHLKRLEIIGFKSFADAFELQFRKGISAIVGPNGCGKSNIADSVRWVLGSQSPKQLRADRMEDVIFSGSESRKPLGMAEVVLTFDNSGRTLPLDFDEVSVARRFYRAGEGDYRINGNRCRLMDITDLIVDRGLGSSGYWILEARMVETILSSRPEDRRFLFDEAAGIVKYKIQRHRAELKLDAASSDLDRLNDIVCEVDRTVGSLKKQVRTYRRFEKAEARIRELEGLLVHRELESSEEKSDSLMESDDGLAGREEGLAAAVSAAAARLAEARLELEKAQNGLDEAHRKCAELDAGIAMVDRDHAVTLERIAAASLSIEENAGRIQWQRDRAGELRSMAAGTEEEIVSVSKELEDLRSALGEAEAEAARLAKDYGEAASRLAGRREERNGLETGLEEARHRYGRIASERERALQELESGAIRRGELVATRKSLEDDLSERTGRLEALLGELKGSSDAISGAEEDLTAVDREISTRREQLQQVEVRAGSVRAVAAGLEEGLPEQEDAGSRLSGILHASEGMDRALGAYLDGFQDARLVTDPGELTGGGGRRYAIAPGRIPEELPGIPDGAVPLTECLEEDPGEGVSGILSGGILAPDRETALSWIFDRVPFDVVTPDGSLFRRDGFVRLGVPASPEGTMDRKALIEEAGAELRELESEAEGLEKVLAEAGEKRTRAAVALAGLRDGRLGLEREEASLRTGIEALRDRIGACDSSLGAIDAAVPGLEKAAADAAGTDLATEIEELRAKLEECTGALREDEALVARLSESLGEARGAEGEYRIRIESLGDRLERSRREKERLLTEAEGATGTAAGLEERNAGLEKKRYELRNREKELESERSAAVESRSAAEEERTAASRARAAALETAGGLEASLQEQREALTLLREQRTRIRGELETVNARILDLRSREIVLPVEGDRYWELDTEALAVELARQRGFREDIGPVNMLAVTEFEEASKRLEYLSGQKEDLEEARESLRQAIDEINRTAARRFAETFVEVRRHFRELFVSLFGGGEADILSLESDDPLEGGVQIMARPRGKKLENVTALSGGERALTAVALLFALYLVKPSPFCILDELDAPLDDSNIDRFIELLRRFSDRTQFVIITHNRRTMEAADRLFGITMAEDGVSVMTTVSLEDIPEPDPV